MEQFQWNNEEQPERVILVAVCTGEEADTERSLDELGQLVETAGGEVLGQLYQNREYPEPGTYIGKGKIEEIRELAENMEADGIVCDDELSPAQMRNLSNILGLKVMDRTLVILDIFAQHARTNEGRIQVELAQLSYRASHLTGMGVSMSRLGGGIGTRGPGETKLEMDRRRIASRISQLKKELREVVANREQQRKSRQRQNMPVAAIVGYTNAGKSTLLNALTDAGILAEDKLFATLDVTTRKLLLPGKQEILLTDTVGFISKLPHNLVDAFRSTLEEAVYADYIIHVVDASNPHWEEQMVTVYRTLDQLGVSGKKIFTLFNKMDQITDTDRRFDRRADRTLQISAKKGTNLEKLQEEIAEMLAEDLIHIQHTFTYSQMDLVEQIRKKGRILAEEYREDGVYLEADVPAAIAGLIRE
ncbi:MAG: GTPase HflX [Lachnospiraceae bacterium]|jgi:GTP-binding protein HflX|nr:GTPase HflX [Lachnospiraceae bacterium]MBR0430142.1 GTPase HflX [Lachnospiraceae bacterium]